MKGNPIVTAVFQVLSACIYVLTIISAYGGRVNPEHLATPSLLCLFMPYLGLLTVLAVIAWAIRRKIIFTAAGVLTLIACIPSLSQACPMGHERSVKEGQSTFTVMSWNVLHTQDIREPEANGNRAIEYMIDSQVDIICLTELTNLSTELRNATPEMREMLFSAYPNVAGTDDTDIKMISKYPAEKIDVYPSDFKGRRRFDFFEVTLPGDRKVLIAMVHLYSYGLSEEERNVVTEIKSVSTAKRSVEEFKGPIVHKLKDAFRKRAVNARNLRSVIDDLNPEIPLIVCGDFNDVPSSWTYNLIKGDDLRDAYSETNFGPAFTYNLHKFYFHIDQMLYRGPIEAISLDIGNIDTSDHYPLIGKFAYSGNSENK